MSSSTSLANRGRTGGHPVGLRLFPPLAVNPSLDWKFRLASACNRIAGECGPLAELASYRRATGVQSISRTNDIAAPSIVEVPLWKFRAFGHGTPRQPSEYQLRVCENYGSFR